jgi:membrane associated rhomboid family serine protease
MIPLGDEKPMLRTPFVTIFLIVGLFAVWIFIQGAGLDPYALAASVCNFGMVPGEITHSLPVGKSFPMGPGLSCVIDRDPINIYTPITSMFLHGGWGHLLGNSLFLWVFGKSVEDSMGPIRFLTFYLVCGIAAAMTQLAIDPSSGIPMVGASGAISGVLGGYLLLYPTIRVRILFILFIFIRIIALPAWMVLLWWIGWQIVAGLPQLTTVRPEVSSGVAVWAHIGGFFTGLALVMLFANKERIERRGGRRQRPAALTMSS